MRQMDVPFPLDKLKLTEFLTRYIALENETDRLREEKRIITQHYSDGFPLRAVLVAIKRVRALHKLEAHPKEPMKREHLATIEHLVEGYLAGVRQSLDELAQVIDARLAAGERVAVNMSTGEVAE